jgi:hypothetical protein
MLVCGRFLAGIASKSVAGLSVVKEGVMRVLAEGVVVDVARGVTTVKFLDSEDGRFNVFSSFNQNGLTVGTRVCAVGNFIATPKGKFFAKETQLYEDPADAIAELVRE